MKTLHLTNAWHERSGGVATFYRALMEEAAREQRPLRLVVPGAKTSVEDVNPWARIYTVRSTRAPFNRHYRMLWPHQFLLPGSPVQRILAAERPGVVEIADKYTLPYLGGLLRLGALPGLRLRPLVVALTSERLDDNMRAYLGARGGGLFSRLYLKWLYFPLADHHIANSAYTAAELLPASRGHKVRRGVWVGPMGVDTKTFSPSWRSSAERTRWIERTGGSSGTALLVYAGRLAPEKNLGLLPDMMGRLARVWRRDYRLVVAGDGISRREFLESCRRTAPGQVEWLGYLARREELASLYANADVFVHPNPREPFGIAPLEAMASGLPVVAPPSGGLLSYATPDNSWLAAPTGEDFAAAVERVCDDEAERARRVAAAAETAGRFDWEHAAARYMELYRRLHAGRSGQDNAAPYFYSTPGNWLGQETGEEMA